MNSDMQAVLRVQTLDRRAADLEKEIESLPKHISSIEQTLDRHVRKLEADRAALGANQRERRALEDDIKVQDQKISKLRDQTLQAKTNEQYRAFQHEIEYCEKEIRKFEDRILELMSEAEPLEKNVKAAEESLKGEREQVENEKDRARRRTVEDESFLAVAREERARIATGVNPRIMQDYDRIRKRWRGIAVADATDGKCNGCQMSLRPQLFQDLKRGDKLQFCESCGRILYYNPPVNLEHEMHQEVR